MSATRAVTRPPCGVNFTAFVSRWKKICRRRIASPRAVAARSKSSAISIPRSVAPLRTRSTASSIGVAIPRDRSRYGYLSEHHSYGETDQKAGDYAEDLAAQMLATTLGVEFDPEAAWDERKENWRISDEIVTTRNVTQSAIGDKDGRWSTVVAAAVLVT